ncbi:hypothetical protein OB955_16665 [Halobacteria archaeon AArc-m2/3/4]|uniref:Uncharacterized protein n=1 Tax=Natronoglomus mannanivorans TaxID=2979990 RepID=A0AAP3E493_9EURY|nr:hypothetical protein [Halobacteria archaeon AArc-xg1-1]MCU4974358.1 hypothetical protein [Halobacteria archaeon AArc-m2/3/4]
MAGIIDTIKLAGSLVLAIPAALAGLDFLLLRGDHLTGGALIVFAAALVIAQHYLTQPSDVPGLFAKRAASSVVDGTEADGETDGDAERVEAVQHDSETKTK